MNNTTYHSKSVDELTFTDDGMFQARDKKNDFLSFFCFKFLQKQKLAHIKAML